VPNTAQSDKTPFRDRIQLAGDIPQVAGDEILDSAYGRPAHTREVKYFPGAIQIISCFLF
jgi:hypothetical protein